MPHRRAGLLATKTQVPRLPPRHSRPLRGAAFGFAPSLNFSSNCGRSGISPIISLMAWACTRSPPVLVKMP